MSAKTAIHNGDSSLSLIPARESSLSAKKNRTLIYNLHSADTRVVEDLKVIANEEYDTLGKLQVVRYVQYTVVGKNRSWPDFMPVEDFKKLNPKITVKGLDAM